MNCVLLIGNLVKDIEIRFTKTNLAVARFSIAVKREIKNKEGNYEADFISCIAYGKTAELIGKYLTKGSKISIEGHIQTGSYEKDGKKVYTTDIVVNKVQFLDNKKEEENPYEKFASKLDNIQTPF